MDAYYSILYYKTSPFTDEMIALGLFCGGGEGPYIYISENRMKLVKNAIHNNSFLAMRRNIKSLVKAVNGHRESSSNLMLFDPTYTIDLFQKLNKKSNGAIRFSSPIAVNGWMTIDLFKEFTSSVLGENISFKKKNKLKPFHIKWRSVKKAARFKELEKDIAISQLDKEIASDVLVDLFDAKIKTVYKAMDFDVSEKNLKLKIKDILTILNSKELQLVIIAPLPRTKLGRESLDALIDGFPSVKVMKIEELFIYYE